MICYPISVNGTPSRTFEAGSGDKVVVLVHGFTSRADRWRHVIPGFAQAGYRVFAPDLPGHGYADKSPGSRQAIDGYRDFLLDFLDMIGANRATLIGASMGGQVVGAAASKLPERVEALVMIASLGLASISSERIAAMRHGLTDMSIEAIRARLIRAWGNLKDITDNLVREDMLVNTSPGAIMSLNRIVDDLDAHRDDGLLIDALAALGSRLPLLLVWGDNDPLVPVSVGHAARKRMPHARLATITGVNHAPYIEQPVLFQRAVLDFLTGQPGQSMGDGLNYH